MRFLSLFVSAAAAVLATASPLALREEEPSVFRFLGSAYCLVDSTAPNGGPCSDPMYPIAYEGNVRWEGEVAGHNVTTKQYVAGVFGRYNVYIDGIFQQSRDGSIELLFGSHITRSYDFDFNHLVAIPADYVSPYDN